MSEAQPTRVFRFGPFEADLGNRQVFRNGVSVGLRGQPFDILALLLEHPGQLVTHQQLRARLWPSGTVVEFDHSIHAAVTRLREVLGEDTDRPRFIATVPRHGYRFIASVSIMPPPLEAALVTRSPGSPASGAAASPNLDSSSSAIQVSSTFVGEPRPRRARKTLWVVGLTTVVSCAAAGALLFWSRSPTHLPRVLSYHQLTSDGLQKGVAPCGWESMVVTDGARIYFSEHSANVVQVSAAGGGVVAVQTPFSCLIIYDISPDKTELLAASYARVPPDQPLWRVSLTDGEAHRVGDLTAHAAAYSPDGENIAYSTSSGPGWQPSDLYVAAKDGSKARRVVTFPDGFVRVIHWSPDGAVLRINVIGKRGCSTWETSPAGAGLHRLQPLQSDRTRDFPALGSEACNFSWTPDGRYSVFTAGFDRGRASGQLWVRRETRSAFGRNGNELVPLTTGPIRFSNPVASADGRRIYVIGDKEQGELVRSELSSGRTDIFLSGISAEQLDFSPDGKWVVYTTFPEHALWRSRVDGSERLQLASAAMFAWRPRWSPDGTRIAFTEMGGDGAAKVRVIPAAGGTAEVVDRDGSSEYRGVQSDPAWAPDGNTLFFGGSFWNPHCKIGAVDVRTGHVQIVPGSDGMGAPLISPDGRYLLADDAPGKQDKPDQTKLWLFDRQRQQWSELLTGEQMAEFAPRQGGVLRWAIDSRHVFLLSGGGRHRSVYRVGLKQRKLERVDAVDLPNRLAGTWTDAGWLSFAPDGSVVALRDISVHEIYALEVDLP